MRFLLLIATAAIVSCGTPVMNSAVPPDGSIQVRLKVTDAASGAALPATASGTNVSCLPDGEELLCALPGLSRYPVEVSAAGHVTMPVWIGAATASTDDSPPSPIPTSVAVSLPAGGGRFSWSLCPPCPLTVIPIEPVDASTRATVAGAAATLTDCTGDCACRADAGQVYCQAPSVGPLPITVGAPGYRTARVSVPVASFGNESCCWGGTSVSVPMSRN
jgi:hypothetical protein